MREPTPLSAEPPPLPRPRLLRQRWREVAFLHWAVDPEEVAPLLPAGVVPDLHEGSGYVGLVTFRMESAGLAHGPAVPGLDDFLETNVRVYSVDAQGRRGVVFLSMDADRRAVVTAGRALYGLPYRFARLRFQRWGAERRYTADLRRRRLHSRVAVTVGAPVPAGPLEHFLTARWGLHVGHVGRTWFVPTTHEPWPLRRAELIRADDDLVAAALGRDVQGPPCHVAYSDGVTARLGHPTPVSVVRSRPASGLGRRRWGRSR